MWWWWWLLWLIYYSGHDDKIFIVMSKRTVFNPKWIWDPELSRWVSKHPTDPTKARCVLCGKDIGLANMGKQALLSHAKGEKHKVKFNLTYKKKAEQQSVSSYLLKVGPQSSGLPSRQPRSSTAQRSGDAPGTSTKPATVSGQSSISSITQKEGVSRAEILWTAKVVMDHYSCSSSSESHMLFQTMFPDSSIAKQFRYGKTKCSYLIQYGLAPYFRQKVLNEVDGK